MGKSSLIFSNCWNSKSYTQTVSRSVPLRAQTKTYQDGVNGLAASPLEVVLEQLHRLFDVELVSLEESGVEVLVEQQLLDFVDEFFLVDDSVDERLERIEFVVTESREQAKGE